MGRRFVTLCREGWYYLFVLTFIVGGATLRDVNLMFLLAALMIGPLLINWRLVVMSVRQFYVERRLPESVFAGRAFRVDLVAENRRRHLGSRAMLVEDWIEPEPDAGQAAKRQERRRTWALLPHVPARTTGQACYRVTLPHRGRYRFGPLRVSCRFPLGLVKATLRLKQPARLLVYPRIGTLSPNWLRTLEAATVGHYSHQHRQGPIDGDYYGLREWRTGDSRRWIHWRTTAKLGRLAVRQFEQQQNRDLAVVLDLWQPEEPDNAALVRVERAVSLAATMIEDVTRQGSRRLLFAQAAAEPGWWSAGAGAVFVRQIFERLALVQGTPQTRLPEVLAQVAANVPAGMQVVVVSTRPSGLEEIRRSPAFADKPRQQRQLAGVTWLAADDPQTVALFEGGAGHER